MTNDNLPETAIGQHISFSESQIDCKVINAERHKEMLASCPHKLVAGGDLAVVPICRLDPERSFVISNEVCQQMQKTPSEVLSKAIDNLRQTEYSLRSVTDVINTFSKEKVEDECPLYVLSTKKDTYGAAVIMNPSALKEAQEKIGNFYYILPSSTHEVLLISKSMSPDPEDLQKMVESINQSCVEMNDQLSNNVFEFNGRSISIANTRTDQLTMTPLRARAPMRR